MSSSEVLRFESAGRGVDAGVVAALSALGRGVALVSGDRVVLVNEGLLELCASTPSALRHRSELLQHLDVGQRARLARLLSGKSMVEEPQRFAAVLVRSDGRRTPVEIEVVTVELAEVPHHCVLLRRRGSHDRARQDGDGWQRQAFVKEAGELLASTRGEEHFLHAVAQLAVPRFADWCMIETVEPQGGLRLMASVHVERDAGWLAVELRRTRRREDDSPYGLDQVLQHAKPVLIADVDDAITDPRVQDPEPLRIYHALGIRSVILAPMIAAGRVVGVLRFFAGPQRAAYTPADVEAARELGRRAGVAFDHARLSRSAGESLRERDQLLAAASHELRTPLTALLLQMQSIERALQDPSELDRTALASRTQKAVRHTRRLASLVEELLDASQLATGRVWLTREEVDLNELVAGVVARFREQAATVESELVLRTCGAPRGHWDRPRIEQVVEHLLSNALKFAPGAPIEIRTQVSDGMAEISVRDSGPGIEQSELQRIFERYERAASRSGLGLGLYVARELVRAHGGTVEAVSVPGQGATFLVRLPTERLRETERWSFERAAR